MPPIEELRKAFQESIKASTQNLKEAAVLFSGGLDSSIIAKAISEKIPATLFTVALENSPASEFSSKAAEMLNLPLVKVLAAKEQLPQALQEARKIIGSGNSLQLQIAVPMFFAMRAARQAGFSHAFCGQGADELFFGYDEFRRELEKGVSFEFLEEMRRQKLANMQRDNLSRDLAIAKHFSLELKAPFLDPGFVKQALAFSARQNIAGAKDFQRKRVLRKLAEQFSLPKEISRRKKKAIQYDSGLSKEIKNLLSKSR